MKALLPAAIGAFAVFQGVLNKRVTESWGLAGAVFLNATVFLVGSAAYFLWSERSQYSFASTFKPWFLVPGFCGLVLVTGIPYSISKWGALQTFIVIIASQVVVSAFWDYWGEGIGFTTYRWVGAAVALVGAWLTTLK